MLSEWKPKRKWRLLRQWECKSGRLGFCSSSKTLTMWPQKNPFSLLAPIFLICKLEMKNCLLCLLLGIRSKINYNSMSKEYYKLTIKSVNSPLPLLPTMSSSLHVSLPLKWVQRIFSLLCPVTWLLSNSLMLSSGLSNVLFLVLVSD